MKTMPLRSTASDPAYRMTLPAYEEAVANLAREERGEGWLVHCEERDIYQFPTREWVDALAGIIRGIGPVRPLLEVGAGRGALGRALRERGIPLQMTDPKGSEGVEALDTAAALARYRPDFVLSSWLPYDAGAEAEILRDPGAGCYLAIVQTGDGFTGGAALQDAPGWEAAALPEADRWSVSRMDFLSEVDRGEHIRRGRAYLLKRVNK